jgi:hypothetical protein
MAAWRQPQDRADCGRPHFRGREMLSTSRALSGEAFTTRPSRRIRAIDVDRLAPGREEIHVVRPARGRVQDYERESAYRLRPIACTEFRGNRLNGHIHRAEAVRQEHSTERGA